MKQAVLKLMLHARVFSLFRLANRRHPLIITYHRFSEKDETDKVSAEAFDRHLDYLSSRYEILSLSRVARLMARGQTPPAGTAVITIDDGYYDAYEVAFPILRKYRAPATIFVATGFVDGWSWMWTDKMRYMTARTTLSELQVQVEGQILRLTCQDGPSRLKSAASVNALLKKLPNDVKERNIDRLAKDFGVELPKAPPDDFAPVTWEQLREMAAGGVEAGSHTVTHPILTNVEPLRLECEMRDSKSRLENMLGREAPLFCYPNGALNARVRRAVADAGYKCAVSTSHGLNNQDCDILALRRISADPDMAQFAQYTSGFEHLKIRFRNARTPKGVK
jgi:peptidoglycan/xylan/chitin deacetylase (PgdA/CDA1 family)